MQNNGNHLVLIIFNTVLFATVIILGIYIITPRLTPSSTSNNRGGPSPTSAPSQRSLCVLDKDSLSLTKVSRGKLLRAQMIQNDSSEEQILEILLTKGNRLMTFRYPQNTFSLISYLSPVISNNLSLIEKIPKNTTLQVEETFNTEKETCPNVTSIKIVKIDEQPTESGIVSSQ